MKRVNEYPDDFKFRIVKQVLEGELTKAECRRKYGIKGHCTVLKWIRKFEKMYEPLIMKNDKKTELENLKQQLKVLKMALDYEKLKSQSYLEMIKLAEEELKIPIRKKPGAKQSKK